LCLALVTGCGGKPPADQFPDDPDALTLYSIDGTGTWQGPTKGPPLHDYPVLGWVEVIDPDQRREVMAAVKGAIRNAPLRRSACFFPRHVLRVTTGGKTTDLVICFQCENYQVRNPDGSRRENPFGLIARDGQPLLDRILTDAGVALAPKLGD
jgi:hypothetical protein